MERLPKKGSYFTREMPSVGPGTSIIINKDKDGVVRAFYNLCRHRGNKLVWNDYPGEEVSGYVPPVHLQVPRLALRARTAT